MVRPNRRALTAMAYFDRMVENGLPPEGEAVCAHVRHGDKKREMHLHSINEYLMRASELTTEPPGPGRHLFVVTGDPRVIDDLRSEKYSGSWAFHWLKENLTGKGFYFQSDEVSASRVLKDLTTLRISSRCRSFIGTIESNWSRLIQELRDTVGLRNGFLMFDLSNGCSGWEDCKISGKEFDFEW